MSQARAVVVGPGEGATVEGPAGGPLTFKVRGDQTNGSLTAFENIIAPDDGPPLHVHAHEDEAWYLLEGELRFRLGADIRVAATGSFVFVPRGVPHCFQNIGVAPARILVLFTPSGMERFFDRFAALPHGAVSQNAFKRVGSEVGMDVVGPPLAQARIHARARRAPYGSSHTTVAGGRRIASSHRAMSGSAAQSETRERDTLGRERAGRACAREGARQGLLLLDVATVVSSSP